LFPETNMTATKVNTNTTIESQSICRSLKD
jgi:hypothetical protein